MSFLFCWKCSVISYPVFLDKASSNGRILFEMLTVVILFLVFLYFHSCLMQYIRTKVLAW